MKRMHFAYVATAILAGCASTPEMGNVIPSEGGIYQVVATGENDKEALSSALFSAKRTCDQRQMRFVVIDRREDYKGLVPEDANNVINKVSEIVPIPTLSGDDDYRITMRFKCEA